MGALAPGAARERHAAMTRAQLEHVIRAAADIADDDEIVIIGSQSILGAHPNAPAALLVSAEADVYPKNRPERWDLIDGSIGEGSPFHDTYGYYAQGVEEGTATLPSEWKTRLVLVSNANTRHAKGWCLDPQDLLLAKYFAGRDKDHRFTRDAARAGIAQREALLARLDSMAVDDAAKERIRQRLAYDFASVRA
jgi:uncharacterized nucleotidyltransferase DUF6036